MIRITGCLLALALRAATADSDQAIAVFSREAALLETFTLPNGLTAVLKADTSAPVVSVQFWVHSGSIHEDPFLGSGIAHAVEHMIFKGTDTLEPGELSRRIQEAGGRVNAYTTFDRTVYHADLPSRNWQIALDLFAGSLFDASFPEKEWESERDVILREIAMTDDDPGRVLGKHLWQNALRVSPYRHPVIGYTDTFLTLTREDLVAFHRRHYTPDNTTLVLVGDIDIDSVREHVEKTLGGRTRYPREAMTLPVEPPQAAPRRSRFTGAYNLSRMGAIWQVPAFPHADAAPLQVLSVLAGGGRTSRLQRELVEDADHFLGISAWYFDRGFFGVSGTFQPDRETDALQAWESQMSQLRSSTFDPAEIDRAVRMILSGTLQSFTTMSGQAAHYGRYQHLAGNPALDHWWFEQITRVTADDLARVAETWLHPDHMTKTVLAPSGTTPARTPPEPFVPTELTRIQLDNGTVLLIRPNPRLPFVYMAAALRGGLLAEPQDKAGITALMADLLTRGTAARSRDEIALEVESRGATLSPFSGFNAFGVTAQSLRSDSEVVLTLLLESLQHPVFPQEELDRQRARQIATIRRSREQPMSLAQEQLRELLFGNHPYRHQPAGTEASVANLTREDLLAFHESQIMSGNLVLAIFGDVDAEAIREQIEAGLSGIPQGQPPEIVYAPVQDATPTRKIQEAPRQQAIVLKGVPGVDLFDSDYEALSLLDTAMSGLSSTLSKEIRETRGLAYFTGTMQQAGLHPGFFAVYAGTAAESVEQVEMLMQTEIARITESGLEHEELESARARMLAAEDMRSQNQMGLAMDAALHELYGIGAEAVFTRQDRLRAVTAEDIQRAAQRLFREDRTVTSILLPMQQQGPSSDAGTIDE